VKRPARTAALAVAALTLAALALAGCGGNGGAAAQAETLQSVAADGALLARDVGRSRTTSAFLDVHAGELEQEAGDLARTGATGDVRALARRVERLLAELREEPVGGDAAAALARELDRASDAAARLVAPS
jgi:hypothetical protein